MQELTIFENETFGAVRTMIDEEGNPLFCGRDVALALGYATPTKAINSHCKGVAKMATPSAGGVQTMIFIPESDVYRLVIKSKLPAAVQFEQWVFKTVLPAIRKHGGYLTREALLDIYKDREKLSDFLKQMTALAEENGLLSTEQDMLTSKAQYFDIVMDRSSLSNFQTTAKAFHIPQKQFIAFLVCAKYLFRDSQKRYQPMQKYVSNGVFVIKEFYDKEKHYAGLQTLITPKGRSKIFNVLVDAGLIVPTKEGSPPLLHDSDSFKSIYPQETATADCSADL